MINTGGASQAKIEEQDKDITAMVKQIALLNIKIEELEAALKRLGDDRWISRPKKKGAKPENIHISKWFNEWDARIEYARAALEDKP